MTRTSLALLAAGVLLALPAYAQLGTTSNPPPQNLFNFQQPKRLDTGLGSSASTRSSEQPVRPRRRATRHAR